MTQPNVEKQYRTYFKEGSQFEQWKSNPFLALYMYDQLQQEFSWEAFKNVFAQYHELFPGQRPKSDQNKERSMDGSFFGISRAELRPIFPIMGYSHV